LEKRKGREAVAMKEDIRRDKGMAKGGKAGGVKQGGS